MRRLLASLALLALGPGFAAPFRALDVLVPAARGSDAVTVTCLTDVLTRAGARVTLASVEATLKLRLSHGLTVLADVALEDCGAEWAAIACPGGEVGDVKHGLRSKAKT